MELTLIQKIAVWALPVIFAITVHEVSHGWVANRLGDPTARMLGRLTLNPIKHIDPIGSLLVPAFLLFAGGFVFGWAKPVPITAQNMKNPRRDMAIVALAGPVSNLIMAFLWAIVARVGVLIGDATFALPMIYMGLAGIAINIALAVLNLLPLPPLDGGRVLSYLLPPKMSDKLDRIEPYGFFILLGLLITGILGIILGPAFAVLQVLFRSVAGL
ncbi:MAG TPA: site-2 protease family protein [Gammaproteobacteria bacterium]|nr:site-2 protease family protein [Gammaproteobacteria bacterium]